jgi:ABC-type multidrug transport system ATPase subunit
MTSEPNQSPGPSTLTSFLLQVDKLGVTAGDSGRELLSEITLSVMPGEFVCVLGPSGAGKTTLVRTLLGQLTPDRGEIRFGSLRVSGDTRVLSGLVGYVPQKEIVHDALPVGRALHYAAKLRLPPSLGDREVAQRIDTVANDVGISHRLDTPVAKLSGGESKRVSLAVELLALPRLLIVDEATSSLDPASDARIMQLLSEYAKLHNITVLCVTHHLENAKFADRLVLLASGRLVWSGGARDALEHFGAQSLSEIYVLLEDLPVEQWVGLHKIFQHQQEENVREQPKSAPTEMGQPPRLAARPSWFRQFRALLLRGLEVLVCDRGSMAFIVGVPLLMVALAYGDFSDENFGDKAYLTRPLEPREIQLAGQLWGHTLDALAMSDGTKAESMSVPAQIRVFLDKEPKMKERLGSPETAELVKKALAGDLSVVPDKEITNPWPTWKFRFTVMFGILILGFLAGLTEIVKERPILERESANGVATSAYIASKFCLLGIVLAVQVVPAVCLLQVAFRMPEVLSASAPWSTLFQAGAQLGELGPFLLISWLAAMVCAGIGLVFSGLVKSRERVLLVLPLLILPQLLLGGMLIRLKGGMLTTVAEIFVPAFWAFRGTIDYVVVNPPVPLYDIGEAFTRWQAAGVLALQMVAIWLIAYFALVFSLRRFSAPPKRG